MLSIGLINTNTSLFYRTSGFKTDTDMYNFLKTLNGVRLQDPFANKTMNIHVSDQIYVSKERNFFTKYQTNTFFGMP